MSDFFRAPTPPPEPPAAQRQPEWLGPPDNVLGVIVPLQATLARTAELALAVQAAEVFPNGVHFSARLLLREELRHPTWHPFMHPEAGEPLSPEILRLGAEYADGSKATNLELPFFARDIGERPPGPVLMPRGGGGGGRRWDLSFWLWPLPRDDPFSLVVEWPARGVGLRREPIDVAPLVDAAARAEELWPDGGPGDVGGSVSIQVVGRARAERPPTPPPHD